MKNTITDIEIKIYGNDILRKIAEEVTEFGEPLREIADEMYKIMVQSKGIGIAAPQIGISKRFIIVEVDRDRKGNSKIEVVNPKIIFQSSDTNILEEGCLSVPGIYADVKRPNSIIMQGYSVEGEPFEISASGIIARVLLHEYDHLEGTLFIDKIEEKDKKNVENALKKLKKC